MAKKRWEYWTAPDGLTMLEYWARDGLTEEDIASNMGISVRTLARWKEKFRPICQAINNNKNLADARVENALYKRSTGCVLKETVVIRVKTPDGKVTETTKETHREIPPDTAAATFWLKNRQPKKYRDKQEIELSGNVGIAEILEKARGRAEKHDKE